MNGWITIGAKLDSKQLEKDIRESEKELARYSREGDKLAEKKQKIELDLQDYEKEKEYIHETTDKRLEFAENEQQINTLLEMEAMQVAKLDEEYRKQEEELTRIGDKITENTKKQSEAKDEVKSLNDKLKNVKAYENAKAKISEMGDALKNMASKGDIKGLTTKLQGIGKTVKGITTKIMKWGLALFGIRTAYNFIRQSANTVFQQNEGLANQVQLMKSAISTALEPLIRNLVSLVYTLFSFVNQIVAKLTGKNLFAQAQKNLEKGAGSAKEINKQFARFDEMNVLSDNSGGGGAGGGVDTSGFVEANAKLMELLEKLKTMFEKGDWEGIARTISLGIIKGLVTLTEKIKAIDWIGIGKAISEFLTGIEFKGIFTSFVNLMGEAILAVQDLLLAIDWPTVFKNLSQAIADSIARIGDYLQQIRWEDIGTMLSDTFTSIQWGEIGSNILTTLWTGLQGLWDLIFAIDWGKVGQTLSDGVHNLITTLITIFQETDWVQLGQNIVDAIFDFIEGIDWIQLGSDILLGLLNGISAMIQLLISIFNEIITRILELFGIHSPSTVFADIGIELIEGLINGIKDMIASIINTFKIIYEKIKEVFTTMLNWIKEKIITPLGNFFTNLWNGIKDGVKNAYEFIKHIFQSVVDFFRNIISNIISLFTTIGSKVGDAISGAFKNVINSVLGGVEKILNAPIKAINGLINTINAIPGINLGKLSTFSLPRLAQGGIINQPGRGVMVGSAIAGERGREGVIPLTDSQQMAMLGEAIGKYITINANITNTMNGRVISRELQKVQNQNDFAFNR